MCGIAGFLAGTPDHAHHVEQQDILRRMTDTIAHRGPDAAGQWRDNPSGIGLGHRRLAIIDVSVQGHQPMASVCGRYVLVFNGEIYNHASLRERLGLQPWRGHSDTETVLACFSAYGVELTLPKLVGMFAFAVWDRQQRTLLLARDRLGEKPLYYGWQGEGDAATFLFGSELKALRAHPAFNASVDRDALCLLMRLNCIPAPHSIFNGIRKLPPGSYLTVSSRQRDPAVRTYWSGSEVAERGNGSDRFLGTAEQAVDELESLLKDAVRQQMTADVPLGAFLSGGVDSSTVVALMQAQSAQPIKTFSIGFQESAYNEAGYAKTVAQYLGTHHTELYVTPEQAMAVIQRLPFLYDEPFADSSQIPTFLVSQLARRQVTVSLSGDGGDELFCGYDRYRLAADRWNKLSAIPGPLRAWAAQALTRLLQGRWPYSADKLLKGAGMLGRQTPEALYLDILSHWRDPAALVVGGEEPATFLTANMPSLAGLGTIERMMALDLLTYLPDDILTKVDRAAMGVSLETRVPFLDHRVVEFAWTLPLGYKLRDGQTKWALRQVLYRHVPKHLIERPKMGFAVPIDAWLRGPLKDWAQDLLDVSRLRNEGYLNPSAVRLKWDQHLSGSHNWQNHLWNVLMFQLWLQAQKAI